MKKTLSVMALLLTAASSALAQRSVSITLQPGSTLPVKVQHVAYTPLTLVATVKDVEESSASLTIRNSDGDLLVSTNATTVDEDDYTWTLVAGNFTTNVVGDLDPGEEVTLYGFIRCGDYGEPLPPIDFRVRYSGNQGSETYVAPDAASWIVNGVTSTVIDTVVVPAILGSMASDTVTFAPNGDHGDFTYAASVATLDADVVAPAEMANADHGDVAWASGVATVEAIRNVPVTNASPTDNYILKYDAAISRLNWEADGGAAVETDPVWGAVSNDVTTQSAAAYGWGDHSTNGYLTTYAETDPVWGAVSNTTTTGAANGTTAYGWGDHGTNGYLTALSGDGGSLTNIDHGTGLVGLGDDDHTIYILADGTRAMSGNLDLDNNAVNNGGASDFSSITIGTGGATCGNTFEVQTAAAAYQSIWEVGAADIGFAYVTPSYLEFGTFGAYGLKLGSGSGYIDASGTTFTNASYVGDGSGLTGVSSIPPGTNTTTILFSPGTAMTLNPSGRLTLSHGATEGILVDHDVDLNANTISNAVFVGDGSGLTGISGGGGGLDTRDATNTIRAAGFPISNIDYTTMSTNATIIQPAASGLEAVSIVKVSAEWRRYKVFYDGSAFYTNINRID